MYKWTRSLWSGIGSRTVLSRLICLHTVVQGLPFVDCSCIFFSKVYIKSRYRSWRCRLVHLSSRMPAGRGVWKLTNNLSVGACTPLAIDYPSPNSGNKLTRVKDDSHDLRSRCAVCRYSLNTNMCRVVRVLLATSYVASCVYYQELSNLTFRTVNRKLVLVGLL